MMISALVPTLFVNAKAACRFGGTAIIFAKPKSMGWSPPGP